jgi:hypothetical protein
MPTYIRQVKASDWAALQDGDTSPQAVALAVDGLFTFGSPSVFLADDLRDVAILALARMAKRTEGKFDFLVIGPEVLTSLAIPVAKTPGDTLLPYANDRHYELQLDRPSAERLVRALACPKACLESIPKKTLKQLAKELEGEVRCHAPVAWFWG